jgi:hypothetical protein
MWTSYIKTPTGYFNTPRIPKLKTAQDLTHWEKILTLVLQAHGLRSWIWQDYDEVDLTDEQRKEQALVMLLIENSLSPAIKKRLASAGVDDIGQDPRVAYERIVDALQDENLSMVSCSGRRQRVVQALLTWGKWALLVLGFVVFAEVLVFTVLAVFEGFEAAKVTHAAMTGFQVVSDN